MAEAAVRDDNREYQRIPSIVPVDYQLTAVSGDPLDAEIRTGFTRDISEGGLCLRVTSLPSKLGEAVDAGEPHITIDVNLPGRRVRIHGRVVWARAEADARVLGVMFHGLAKENSDALAEFARRAAARPRLVRSAFIGLMLLLAITGGLYYMTRAEAEESKRALAAASANSEERSTEMAKMWRELRWLSDEVGAMSELMSGENPEGERVPGAAIEDLARNIEELREVIERVRGDAAKPPPQ